MTGVLLGLLLAILAWQSLRAFGLARGALAGGLLIGAVGLPAAYWSLPGDCQTQVPLPRVAYVTSATCWKCHPSHYDSWHRSYHRTMTQEAGPDTVRGDFQDRTLVIRGIPTRLRRRGNRFFMETADPAWARQQAASGKPPEEWGRPRLKEFEVVRLVGSHWFQECLYRDEAGRYWRLPVSYHIARSRWVHTNGAFLAPDTDDFWEKSTLWNESCVYCHNTKPSKRPRGRLRLGDKEVPAGYDTRVAELGIACEACHGPGDEHVRANRHPGRRLALRQSGQADPTIVNPKRLSPQRASEICGHCHGSTVPRADAWDSQHTDPYTPGEDLERFLFVFWSEAEQKQLYAEQRRRHPPPPPEPLDGRFWGDGTPLTTAVEFQGMALSRCYENGSGKLSCLTCHSMHDGPPHFQLARGMDSNEACYQCHDSYRHRLEAHTHHRAGSPGSLCYNCHMPYQAYSLLAVHRTHRIHSPRIEDSLGTGKPHACNLCHLDKTLAWTQQHLAAWYGSPVLPLPQERKQFADSVVHLLQADARSRAVYAGAFAWLPAQQASGTDWMGPVLLDVLQTDRYPAVRYLAEEALRSIYGEQIGLYDYMAAAQTRAEQVGRLRRLLPEIPHEVRQRHTAIPLGSGNQLDPERVSVLLLRRYDPDVTIHE
jgi:predicted CXXCH cytochrome family protein